MRVRYQSHTTNTWSIICYTEVRIILFIKKLTTETDTKYYRLSFTVYKLNHLHMSLFRGMMISGGFAVTKFYCIALGFNFYTCCQWIKNPSNNNRVEIRNPQDNHFLFSVLNCSDTTRYVQGGVLISTISFFAIWGSVIQLFSSCVSRSVSDQRAPFCSSSKARLLSCLDGRCVMAVATHC